MYEYEPPGRQKDPLNDDPGFEFVPLKDQLAGVPLFEVDPDSLDLQAEKIEPEVEEPLDQYVYAAPVSPEPESPSTVKIAGKDTLGYMNSKVDGRLVSINMSLLISGIIVMFMLLVTSYTPQDTRITVLICLGVGFLLCALLSLFGSHFSKRDAEGSININQALRAFNGLTVGLGIGFVLCLMIFFAFLRFATTSEVQLPQSF